MKLLKDLQTEYQKDKDVISQLELFFGEYSKYEKEYDEFFNGEYINQVINESSSGNGHIAGSGPVDYNEGKILFLHIRKHKPKLVLEIGTASGCSAVIMARALELNKIGKLHTVDISTDNYEEGINMFRKYVDKGIIETKFGWDGIQYILENSNIPYDVSFIDADHAQEFCYGLAKVLFLKYPSIPHFYHEYSLTSLGSPKEHSYVSYTQHIGATFEREAFENVFSEVFFERKGFYGSCGLGLIQPKPIHVFYRLSSKNATVPKNKLSQASKTHCLDNFISVFSKENLYIQADNCSEETINDLTKLGINFKDTSYSSSPESFIMLLEEIKKLNDDDIVYIVEDDYLHLHNAKKILFEGLLTGAHYVTGYDHPDKYLDPDKGGNPYVESGGEVTRVLLTALSHWKMTNSTYLTFLTTAKNIKEDFDIWKKSTFDTPSLGSFYAFITLREEKGKVLISSIPSVSTHTETKWVSPLINWNQI